ncbi:MAG: 5-formyltetrahydrofolate cyclo-ligase [Clostridiales bacterium]|nr:5-formyltetrahydrofolate cyclo-ligase [Clostridiales bacterium]
MDIKTEKKIVREKIKKQLQSVNNQFFQGEQALAHILNWDTFRKAQVIACFSSMQEEIDTLSLLKEILRQGKTLCLPRVEGKGKMIFLKTDDLQKRRAKSFGILEPMDGEKEVKAQEIDLCFVPALAVSEKGQRLGRGGGYYDRMLPQIKGTVCALVLNEQVVAQLPCEKHDYLLKYIIDSRGLFIV